MNTQKENKVTEKKAVSSRQETTKGLNSRSRSAQLAITGKDVACEQTFFALRSAAS